MAALFSEDLITDHKPVVLDIEVNTNVPDMGTQPCIRNAYINWDVVYNAVINTDLSNIFDILEAPEAFDLLYSVVVGAIQMAQSIANTYNCSRNNCAPRSRNSNPDWFNPTIKMLIGHKNRMYKILSRNRNDSNRLNYTISRNAVTSAIKKARKDFYGNAFTKATGNLKKTWDIINGITGNRSSKDNIKGVDCISVLNRNITDKSEIANLFALYFKDIVQNLNIVGGNMGSMGDKVHRSCFLMPTDIYEVSSIIKHLRNKKSVGHDGITIDVLKRLNEYLSPYLVYSINLCMMQGYYPKQFKLAKIKPIYKSGNKKILSNYRPISILSNLSKVWEKILYNRIYSFAVNNNIISDVAHGFVKGRSVDTANTNLVNFLRNSIDQGYIAAALTVDLSKAFECINFEILYEKLANYGYRGVMLSLINSYLDNRFAYICVDGFNSRQIGMPCGVPQGSTLGPLFFLLFMNDIAYLNRVYKVVMYADDMIFIVIDRDICNVFKALKVCIKEVLSWIKNNMLKVNVKKSGYMLFHAKNKIRADFQVNDIVVNNEVFVRLAQLKYLGVWYDTHLAFNVHIKKLISKMSWLIPTFFRLNSVVTSDIKLLICNALLFSHVRYCIVTWGATYFSHLKLLNSFVNKAVKILWGLPFSANAEFVFVKHGLLSLKQMIVFEYGKRMYNIINNNIVGNFDFNLKNIKHASRLSDDLQVAIKPVRTNYGKMHINYLGGTLWNNIPYGIRESKAFSTFKNKFKEEIILKGKLEN